MPRNNPDPGSIAQNDEPFNRKSRHLSIERRRPRRVASEEQDVPFRHTCSGAIFAMMEPTLRETFLDSPIRFMLQ